MGDWFGAQAFGVTPDLITFAKCVNNGTVPMGGVIARQGIYDAFMQGPEYAVEFFHGYTYSAHPLAVAAAHATLDILHEDDVPKRFAALAGQIEAGVHALQRRAERRSTSATAAPRRRSNFRRCRARSACAV